MIAAPPVERRPLCPGCSRPLQPTMRRVFPRQPGVDERKKMWAGVYKSYGAFCTLRCCEAYANAMFKEHGTMFVIKGRES